MQVEIKKLKFSELRVRFGTGRSFLISGSGRDKRYGYRNGVMTELGDLEISEWKSVLTELIAYHGEQGLQEQLREWCKESYLWLHSKAEVEEEALTLHAARIFDDPAWVDYIPFNRKYRPEVLETADLVWIKTKCCNGVRQVTRTRYERLVRQGDNAVYCQACKDWTAVALTENETQGGIIVHEYESKEN